MHLFPKSVLAQRLACYLIIGLIFSNNLAFALDSDKSQPIVINAASVSFNRQTGVSLYQGNVVISQGSSKLTADSLTVQLGADKHLISILACGKPATYTTRRESAKTPIFLEANTIQYNLLTGKVLLTGNAKATQDSDTFKGPIIEYDSRQQILITPASNQGRTTIIFNPNNAK
jgi:lipopolysaccharide export system protein LptA